MRRERVEIEQLFKEKFENASIEPDNMVWKNLEKNLESIPKKMNFFRWFVSALTIASAVFVYWYWPLINLTQTTQNRPSAISGAMLHETEVLEETLKHTSETPKSDEKSFLIEQKADSSKIFYAPTIIMPESDVSETLPEHFNNSEKIIETHQTKEAAEINFQVSTQNGCAPLIVSFENKSVNVNDFEWSLGDGNTYSGVSLTYVYKNPGTYIVSLKTSENENLTKLDTIIVFDVPEIKLTVNPNGPVRPGEKISFISNNLPDENVKWSFGDGLFSFSANTVHEYQKAGEYDVYCIIINKNSCVDSAFVKKIIVSEIFHSIDFPTAFAPNIFGEPERQYAFNARKNELFFPLAIGVLEYNLKIYNRHGVLLFETNDISIGWTGYYSHKLVPQDVYIFKASGKFENGETFSKAGNVTVVY
jgi:PKD repeat protein